MADITETTNHSTIAKGKVVHVLRGKTNLDGLLDSWLEQIQDLETVLQDILAMLDVDQATGDQLDFLGYRVGEDRLGRSDADYRSAIKLRASINSSRATAEDLTNLLVAFGDATSVSVEDSFPGAVIARAFGVSGSYDGSAVHDALEEAAAVGIAVSIVYSSSTPFQYDLVTGLGYDQGEYAGGY